MKMWKKIILIGITAFIGIAIAMGGYIWYSIGKPIYQPGMVSKEINLQSPLVPPEQNQGHGFWEVAPGIQLSHFSVGAGKNILIVHGGPGAPDAEPWRGLNSLTHDHRFHYYAQRGCGGSSRPIHQFSSSNY